MTSLSAGERSRSPRAPKHSLRQAIDYARLIYKGVHRSPIDAMTAFELMGFTGKSGASATSLGSIRQFGLIEGTGDKTRVSELALAIFEPSSEQERAEAIIEAANKPEVFRSINDRFNGRVPTADEPIRAFLIRELGFSRGGSEETIASLRSTEQDVQEARAQLTSTASPRGPQESQIEDRKDRSQSREYAEVQTSAPRKILHIPLTKECSAELQLIGDVSERAIANLIRHIELMKDVWAED